MKSSSNELSLEDEFSQIMTKWRDLAYAPAFVNNSRQATLRLHLIFEKLIRSARPDSRSSYMLSELLTKRSVTPFGNFMSACIAIGLEYGFSLDGSAPDDSAPAFPAGDEHSLKLLGLALRETTRFSRNVISVLGLDPWSDEDDRKILSDTAEDIFGVGKALCRNGFDATSSFRDET